MFSFLKRSFLIVLGFLLIAVFIWFAGPYFGFGEYHPLEPELARLVAMAVVVGWWLVTRMIKRVRVIHFGTKTIGYQENFPITIPVNARGVRCG